MENCDFTFHYENSASHMRNNSVGLNEKEKL